RRGGRATGQAGGGRVVMALQAHSAGSTPRDRAPVAESGGDPQHAAGWACEYWLLLSKTWARRGRRSRSCSGATRWAPTTRASPRSAAWRARVRRRCWRVGSTTPKVLTSPHPLPNGVAERGQESAKARVLRRAPTSRWNATAQEL